MVLKSPIFYILINFIFLTNFTIIFGYQKNPFKDKSQKDGNFFAKNDINIKGNSYDREIEIEKNMKFNLYFDKDDPIENNIILTVLGNSLINFDLKVYDDDDNYLSEMSNQKYFYNGYGVFVNGTTFDKYNNIRLELQLNQLNQLNEELIYIKSRKINKRNQYIGENDHIDIILDKNIVNEECFSIHKSENMLMTYNKYALNFLTYTKNIKTILYNSFDRKEIEININKESMTYIIKDNEYNEICFNLNGKNETKGSLSIELLNLHYGSSIYPFVPSNFILDNNFTLIRGLSSEHYLPRGKAIIHRIKDYKFRDTISFIQIQFHKIKGKSKLYIIKCDNYPNCQYTKEDFENDFEEYEYEDINGYISIKKELPSDNKNGKNYVAVVYCPDDENNKEDCKYDISMKNEDELTYLYKDKLSFSFVNSDNNNFLQENYKINLENDLTINDKLYINFNLFFGKTNIQFFTRNNNEILDYQTNYLGNNIIYIFKNEVIEENRELNIKINKVENAYFCIKYELKNQENINNYYLEEGILQYRNLSNNSENYYFINDYHEKNFPIIININTYGNDIKIKYENEPEYIFYDINFNLVQIILNEKIDENFSFSILNNENKNSNYLYSITSYSNRIILMNNGQIYNNKLNKFSKEVTYI